MSLDWNLTKIRESNLLCWTKDSNGEDRMNPRTELLIMLTLILGVQITEKTHKEFWRRLEIFQHINGPMLHSAKEDILLTQFDVLQHVGMKTNADVVSKTKFNDKIVRAIEDKLRIAKKEVSNQNVIPLPLPA